MGHGQGKTGCRRWWALLLAGAVCWSLTVFATPAFAHTGGALELYFAELRATPDPGGGTNVEAVVVDRDSGTPAPGFAVTAAATGEDGRPGGTAELADHGNGHYQAVLRLAQGDWTVRVDAKQGLSGQSAVPTSKSVRVSVQNAGGNAPATGGTGAGGDTHAHFGVTVQIMAAEEGLAAPPSPNYVPVKVTVVDAATGQPVPPEQGVAVTPRNPQGEEGEGVPLAYPYKDDTGPPGEYKGWVIVPHGGPWTFFASVQDPETNVSLGVGRVDTTVDAPALESYTKGLSTRDLTANERTLEKVGSVAVLWSHTIVAGGWGIAIGLLALLAVPGGRRLLSVRASGFLDRRLSGLVRAAVWATALVIGTGVINLIRDTVYPVPLSPDQADRLFDLPYARPYMLALGIKLGMYTLMVAASIPLILAARRRAEMMDDSLELSFEAGESRPNWTLDPALSASQSGGTAPAMPWLGRGGGAQLLEKEEVELGALPPEARSDDAELDEDLGEEERASTGVRMAIAVLGGGGLILTLALTALKYIHVLAEGLRGGQ